jgi:hypothetical protein
VAAVLIVGAGIGIGLLTRPPAPPPGVLSFKVASHGIATGDVTYDQTPPVGGDHAPTIQNCGYYRNPVPSANAVASMARGAVWITYKPDINPSDVNVLRQLAVGQTHVIVSPFPNLPANIVASAWGKQMTADNSDDEAIAQFVRAFRLASDAPESGPCAGGVGTPG